MTVITGLLKLFLFVLIALFIVLGIFVFGIVRQLKGTFRVFRQQSEYSQHGQNTPHGNSMNETVSDHRNTQESSQKIIPQDEGEYVDFQEV